MNSELGAVLANAGVNAITGMGTVFVVLILICLIIYCFNIIPVIQNKFSKKQEVPAAKSEPKVSAPAPAAPAPGPSADVPVAVIMAAIYAYEEAQGVYYPPGSFVVRSIKRR